MGILNRLKKTPATEEKTISQKGTESSTKPVERLGFTMSSVIVQPLISEKAAILAGANQYVFIVQKNANRVQVRSAIKAMYGVSPLSINILNVRGKKVRFGKREGTRSDWKKAIVTLPAGQTINVYEGV